MPYVVYKLMHFLGIFMVITALGDEHARPARRNSHRQSVSARSCITHGVAAALILTGGFGMLARMGVMHGALPNWIWAKLAIWVTLAAALVVPYLGRTYARVLLGAVPLLAVAAGAVALYKPF